MNFDDQSEAHYLRSYDIHAFDVPLTTVDVVIFTVREGELQVLLIQRDQHPFRGLWALPGGFIRLKEDADLKATAHRKLAEETGVDASYLEQVASVGNAKRDPRGWAVTVVFFALLPASSLRLSHGKGTRAAQWVRVEQGEVALPLAFDHAALIALALERLRSKVEYTALPVHLLPESFTLKELQDVYELILGRPVNKAAFRRRIDKAGILEELPGQMRYGSNRPAQLFRVKPGQSEHFFDRVFARG